MWVCCRSWRYLLPSLSGAQARPKRRRAALRTRSEGRIDLERGEKENSVHAQTPRQASVAQSLDGKPSDGEPAFPRSTGLAGSGSDFKVPSGDKRIVRIRTKINGLLRAQPVPYSCSHTGTRQSPR